MSRIFCTLFCVIFAINTSAKDINLLTITSSDDKNIYRIGLMINDKTGLAEGVYKREYNRKGQKIKDPKMHMEFSINELRRGVIVVSRSKCSNVVNIRSHHMNPETGARIQLNVVKNCLTGSYLKRMIDVERVKNEEYMVSYENQVISSDQKLHFDVGMFGVKRIKVKRNEFEKLFR